MPAKLAISTRFATDRMRCDVAFRSHARMPTMATATMPCNIAARNEIAMPRFNARSFASM